MALTVGTINKDLSAIHLGSKAVHSVYRGPVKIWPVTLGRMTMTIHTGKFEPDSVDADGLGVFELPFDLLPTYVDWGDGSLERTASHAYSRTNTTRTITLDIAAPGTFWFHEPKDHPARARSGKETLVSIDSSSVDFSRLTTLRNAFYQCGNLNSVPGDLFASAVNVTSCQQIFHYCREISSVSGDFFAAMTKTTNFWFAFSGTGLRTIPANLFASNTLARNFRYCFAANNGSTPMYFTELTSVPSNLFASIPNATDLILAGVFDKCTKIISALPTLWTTHSNCQDYSTAFQGCNAASNYADVPSGWR